MSRQHQFTACLLISFLLACVAIVAQPAAAAGPAAAQGHPPNLTVAVASAPRSLNPATATDSAGARLLQLTHPALLTYNATYQPVGLLAQGCTQPQPQQVACTLRGGLAFTDGTPFTAPAVAAWFAALQAEPLSPFASLKGIRVTAPTSSTVLFNLPSPTLGFVATLTEIPIANPANPSHGAGPYRVLSHDTLGTITLTTSQSGLPVTLTFVPVADATTRLLKLKKAEVDVVFNDIPPQSVQWAQAQGFTVQAVPGLSYSYLGLNMRQPQLANPLVRQAMALALNRPALRTHLLGGMATAASTLLPPTHPAAWAAEEEPFDPFEAENLLDATGLLRGPSTQRFSLTLLTSTDPFSQRVSQVIQHQLRGVGIDVHLRPTEWASFYDSVKKGNFDMVMLAWTGELPPTFYHQAFHSTQTPPTGFNRGHLNDPRTDTLTEAILAATTEEALNAATQTTQQHLAQVRPYIPLYRRHHVLITAPNLTGCTIPPSGAYTGLLGCRKH